MESSMGHSTANPKVQLWDSWLGEEMEHQTDSLTASQKDYCSVHQKGYQMECRMETHWEPYWAPWKGHCSVHQKGYPKDYQLEADWVKPKAHQTVAMTVPRSVHLTGC